MNIFSAIILGAIQGLTEFLPVSSSGHLVIVQQLIPGFSEPGILIEVILHAGTLTSVLYYYRKQIFSLSKEFIITIVVGTIPAVVVGFFFKDQIEGLFETMSIVGFALLLTSFFNYLTDRSTLREENVSYIEGFIIGIFQALAIIPGVSRSGSTIFAGSRLGVDKKKAAQFSFLLSVPAIIGANFLEVLTLDPEHSTEIVPLLFGFFSAFIFGFFAIKMTIRFLEENRFKLFAYYTAVLGFITIVLQL